MSAQKHWLKRPLVFGLGVLMTSAIALSTGMVAPAEAQNAIVAGLDVGPGGDEDARPWGSGAGHTTHIKQFVTPFFFNRDLSAVVPYGVESFEANDDFTVWTYRLRDDLRWSDGEPVTAEDWKFTVDFVSAPDADFPISADRNQALGNTVGYQEAIAGDAEGVSGVRAVDELTVEYTLTGPNPRHFADLIRTYILPAHAIDFPISEFQTTDWFRNPDKMVGSGPFVVKNYRRDEFLTLGGNPNYFEGAPKLDELTVRYFGGDQTAAILALQAGDTDFTYITGPDVASLEDEFDIYSNLSGVVVFTHFNYNSADEDLQDVRVRQAILHAIDREAITSQILGGTFSVLPCPVPFPDLWPEDVNFYEYDPEKAKSLLAEAGVNPSSIEMEWIGHAGYNNTVHNSALQAVQAYLADVGISNFSFAFVDIPTFRSRYQPDGGWVTHYRGYAAPRYGNSFGHVWSNDGGQGGENSGFDMADTGLENAVTAIQTATTTDDYFQAMTNFCSLHNELLPDLQMWVGNRYGAGKADLANFWWQPAPGGGPYDDDAHLWEAGTN